MYKISVRFVHKLGRRELLTKILRVDHIGELAALRIYDGQKAVISGNFPGYYLFFETNSILFLRIINQRVSQSVP